MYRLLIKNEKKRARSFNFTFRYIDDVLSLNNSRFGDFADLSIELEIKDPTDTGKRREEEHSLYPWVELTVC
jgi:hypothetical protein